MSKMCLRTRLSPRDGEEATTCESKLSGNFVKSVKNISDSRKRIWDKAFDYTRCMKGALNVDDYSNDVVETTRRFYEAKALLCVVPC